MPGRPDARRLGMPTGTSIVASTSRNDIVNEPARSILAQHRKARQPPYPADLLWRFVQPAVLRATMNFTRVLVNEMWCRASSRPPSQVFGYRAADICFSKPDFTADTPLSRLRISAGPSRRCEFRPMPLRPAAGERFVLLETGRCAMPVERTLMHVSDLAARRVERRNTKRSRS